MAPPGGRPMTLITNLCSSPHGPCKLEKGTPCPHGWVSNHVARDRLENSTDVSVRKYRKKKKPQLIYLSIPKTFFITPPKAQPWASQAAQCKEPANVGDIRDARLIPGLGRYPGGGHGNPLQYSWIENPMDRGAWLAAVHGVAKSWTRLSN